MNMKFSIIPVTSFMQNCCLVWCETSGKGAVIDPGGDLDTIIDAAEKQEIKLETILLTHAHIDHAGGVADLAKRCDLEIVGPHREDQFLIDNLPHQSQLYGFPPAGTFTPTRWLEHNDLVQIGEVELQVVHCPGHTPGHVVYFHQPSKIAFVGDVLFQGSIGRTDFPRGDYDTLISSIRERLWPLGDEVTFISGHGPSSTFGEERRTNPFVAD
jgi:glyoxylase-like metal-dependent hydrolase (beta-lactamase superfamily II)